MSAPALEGPLGPSLFKVISGCPTPEELAVVTALLSALTASAATTAPDGSKAPGPAPAAWGRPETFPPVSWMARR
ncbi:acyl-CoA carboxylase epsilon subunit [Streptomyces peucetius]|uniref:Acyl-CoA carboxylase subunit epsilon n=1 Tax=Streptomyces peucetius TaxID=1950 RepID=A0ABY6ICV7_STRPE|nr:acyl-CoA carboxylase epsilon subunit [Streptomyces peucetius]UYQ64844.1 acyl-CoA carboxylase subunit epsilon [Streptomyces peucetius]